MKSRRVARASEAVREVVSTTVLFELRDPRIKNVTVLAAEVAKDMRTAKVYVSVMGDVKVQSLAMYGLESARGYIQSKIAERLDTRYTPVLKFVLDQGVKRSIEASRLLREAQPSDNTAVTSETEELDDDELDNAELDNAEELDNDDEDVDGEEIMEFEEGADEENASQDADAAADDEADDAERLTRD